MFRQRSSPGIVVMLFAVFLAACSKEKLNELVDKAKETVSDGTQAAKDTAAAVTDTAKESLALAGTATVNLDIPINTTACYVNWISPGAGRPSVVQIRSYKDAAQESFPSLLLHAQTTAGGISELVGQTIAGQLFVQKAEDAPVWFCPTGAKVDLKVVSVAEQLVTVEIVGGSMRNSQTGADQSVTGKLTGVLP